MAITETEIDSLLHYGEHLTLECKSSEHGLPRSIWETYSAFANTAGGIILLGIAENLGEELFEKRFTLVALNDPERLIRDFWNTINNHNKVSISILKDEDVQIVQYQGYQLIYINVPQVDYLRRPVYLDNNPLTGTFKRNHEGDYHCSEAEVRAMLRDSNESGNDGMLLEHYTIDDIDPEALKNYRNEFQVINPDHILNTLDNHDFLRNLGGIGLNREKGQEWLTLAGLLMFGRGLPIQELLDGIRMDYIDYTNLRPESRWSDRLTYDGTWENNLYNFFRRVMPKLTMDLKRPFQMDGITRLEDTSIHKAIREAMVNLIVHCDFLRNGVLRVEKHDDSFVFINPGTLMLPIQTIYNGGTSKARNPRIQKMMRMIGLGEAIGSGFPTILDAWKKENWRQPDLQENNESQQVELRLWMTSLMPEECSRFLQQVFQNSYMQLSADKQVILCCAYTEKKVSNARLQSFLNIHPTDIGKLLAELTEDGFLKRDSKGRWTTYTLNVESQSQTSLFGENNQGQTVSSVDQIGEQVQNQMPEQVKQSVQVGVQVDVQVNVQVNVQVQRMLEVLGDQSLSREELMTKMHEKSRMRFSRVYLKPALELGLIEMTRPESLHSSKQQYRKVMKDKK